MCRGIGRIYFGYWHRGQVSKLVSPLSLTFYVRTYEGTSIKIAGASIEYSIVPIFQYMCVRLILMKDNSKSTQVSIRGNKYNVHFLPSLFCKALKRGKKAKQENRRDNQLYFKFPISLRKKVSGI